MNLSQIISTPIHPLSSSHPTNQLPLNESPTSIINLCAWNIHNGLNTKVRPLIKFIIKENLDILLLSEASINEYMLQRINRAMPGMKLLSDTSNPKNKNKVTCVVSSRMQMYLTEHGKMLKGRGYKLTFDISKWKSLIPKMTVLALYGPVQKKEKKVFWQKVLKLLERWKKSGTHFVIAGDLNLKSSIPKEHQILDGPEITQNRLTSHISQKRLNLELTTSSIPLV